MDDTIPIRMIGPYYMSFRSDPTNDETTDGMWCAKHGLQVTDLQLWKQRTPQWAQEVLDARRKRYAEHLSEVDAALIEKAKSGDTKAAALLYARFENWTPRIAESESKRTGGRAKTMADLIEEGGA